MYILLVSEFIDEPINRQIIQSHPQHNKNREYNETPTATFHHFLQIPLFVRMFLQIAPDLRPLVLRDHGLGNQVLEIRKRELEGVGRRGRAERAHAKGGEEK